MDLNGAKVLITGGSRGIGKSTAQKLVENGAKVGITARHQDQLNETVEELGVLGINADVSKQADVDKTYNEFLSHYGTLDVLINNAGMVAHGELDNLDFEKMQEVYNTNIFGAAMMGKKAAQLFKEQHSGNIINIGSTAGLKGMPGGSIYVSSKFALRGLTDCWKAELRPYNVRVYQLNPSEVKTAFGREDRQENEEVPNKLRGAEIAQVIKSLLEIDNRGFVPELSVIATNPWD